MKAKNLKIGDKIKTWCCGAEVVGKITELNENNFTIKHKPVNWGNEVYKETLVQKSTPLQMQFYSETTPIAFYNDDPIKF